MKYILFAFFCYKHYKKENHFRIYIDDLLVDDVILNKDINRVGIEYVKTNLKKDSWLRRDLVHKHIASNGAMPLLTERIWLYEVDIKEGHTPKIKLDFKIEDSNYTNGFMTKSAMVRLEKVGLISLDNFLKLQKGYFHEYWGYYKTKRLRLSELLQHKSRRGFYYPTIGSFNAVAGGKTKFIPNFVPDFNSLNNNFTDSSGWLGEDFTVTINTAIKHKTLILPNPKRAPMGPVIIDPVFLLMAKHTDVINMYNENQ